MTRTERGAFTALQAGLGLTVFATVVPHTTHLAWLTTAWAVRAGKRWAGPE